MHKYSFHSPSFSGRVLIFSLRAVPLMGIHVSFLSQDIITAHCLSLLISVYVENGTSIPKGLEGNFDSDAFYRYLTPNSLDVFSLVRNAQGSPQGGMKGHAVGT